MNSFLVLVLKDSKELRWSHVYTPSQSKADFYFIFDRLQIAEPNFIVIISTWLIFTVTSVALKKALKEQKLYLLSISGSSEATSAVASGSASAATSGHNVQQFETKNLEDWLDNFLAEWKVAKIFKTNKFVFC